MTVFSYTTYIIYCVYNIYQNCCTFCTTNRRIVIKHTFTECTKPANDKIQYTAFIRVVVFFLSLMVRNIKHTKIHQTTSVHN